MSKHLQLSIPTPCHENWNNMTPVEKGRFCGSCQKQVVDFSKMSDREIAMFFKKPSTGSVCGRFMEEQLDRDIEIPKKRIPWIKYFFQFLLPAYLMSCTNNRTIGKVAVDEPKTETVNKTCTATVGMIMTEIQPPDTSDLIIQGKIGVNDEDIVDASISEKRKTIDDTLIPSKILIGDTVAVISKEISNTFNVNGKVVDEKNDPIPFASVIIKGTAEGTYASQDGTFSIQIKNAKEDVLSFSSVGFETKYVELNNYKPKDTLPVQLRSLPPLGEVVIVKYDKPITCNTTTEAVTVIKKSSIKNISEGDTHFTNSLKVFPNPVQSGTNLNIEWKQTEEGEYILQLFNQAGQLAFNKAMWIDKDARVLNLEVPHVAAGSYFLRMTNKNSGKFFTEKIIIQ